MVDMYFQDILSMLGEVRQLSTPGQLLQTLAMIHMTDLEAAAPADDQIAVINKTLPDYCAAQTRLLDQVGTLKWRAKIRIWGRLLNFCGWGWYNKTTWVWWSVW